MILDVNSGSVAGPTEQVIEACHHRSCDLVRGDQGFDVMFAVIGWRVALVPQRLGVSQTEAQMDLDHGVHTGWGQDTSLARILQDFLLL